METIRITIPKPCTENWNTMTPQEKGRFCDKCSKIVNDFTNSTDGEIFRFFQEHKNENICGRLRTDQINRPLRLQLSYRLFPNQLSFSQNFFLSLLIVFGTTLFSCTTHTNEKITEIILTDKPIELPLQTVWAESMNGNIFSEAIPKFKKPKKSAYNFQSIEDLPDTVDLPSVDIDASACHMISTMGGLIGYSVTVNKYEDYFPDSTEQPDIIEENIPEESIDVFPNPAHDIVNLRYNLSKDKMINAELYNMEGKLIRTIIPQKSMSAGEDNVQFDIADLPNATYLLRLVKGGVVETKRIVKM